MWIELSKIVVCFFFCSTVVFAYQSKLNYIKQSERTLPKKYSVSSVSGQSYNNDNFKVRQSRYPNFEKVKTRIENMNSGDSHRELYYRIRHKGWSHYKPTTTTTTTTTTDDGLFETYGDLDDEENENLDDYDLMEDEDGEDDYDENVFFEDVQAEEPTERPTRAPNTLSRFGQSKWRHLGTAQDVEESRRQHLNFRRTSEQKGVTAVLEHSFRVNQQGKCGRPLPKVIPVQREHPDPSKIYTPHCTVLHRCAEDTGCCKYDTVCQFKSRDLIHLYFYAVTLGSTETKVEKLSFYNHTECECREKSNTTSAETLTDINSGLSFKSADTFPVAQPIRCNCTKHFQSQRVYDYSKCSCDCEEGNLDCIQLKKGKEHLSMTDRICISNKECRVPVCEYGPYNTKVGRCPNIADKMEEFRRIRIN